MPPIRPTHPALASALAAALLSVNRALGLPSQAPYDPARRGAADVSFVAPYLDALAGLGVHGGSAHSDRETVDLATLPMQIKRAALLIHRLTREPSAAAQAGAR